MGLYIVIILGVLVLIQLSYYIYYFVSIPTFKKRDMKMVSEGVSIVICAKNELENIKKNLPFVIDQDYANFEVIIVNDGSWDGTYDYLESINKVEERLHVIHLEKDNNHFLGKKFALTMGIKAAKNDIILLTDADCKPCTVSWVKGMVSHFENEIEVVIGYSPYKRYFGLLNAFIQFETAYVGMQYLSYAIKKNPYMGVGRNMAYRKSLFMRKNGFASNMNVVAGDDDLLIQNLSNGKNTSVCLDSNAFTISEPYRSLGKWWNQKKRHLGVGNYYKPSIKRLLGVFNSSVLLYYLFAIGAFVVSEHTLVVLGIVAFRTLFTWVIIGLNFWKLKHKVLWFFYPIFDLAYFIYYILLGPISLFKRKTDW